MRWIRYRDWSLVGSAVAAVLSFPYYGWTKEGLTSHDLKKRLETKFSCVWAGTKKTSICKIYQIQGSITLSVVDTLLPFSQVEIVALSASNPKNKTRDRKSQLTVVNIIEMIRPISQKTKIRILWDLSQTAWSGFYDQINIGKTIIQIRSLQPADIESSYADITIGRQDNG